MHIQLENGQKFGMSVARHRTKYYLYHILFENQKLVPTRNLSVYYRHRV